MFPRSFTLVLLFLAAASLPVAAEVTVKGDGAWLREGVGMSSALAGRLRGGETVGLLERSGDWVRVQRPGGIDGWIHESFLAGLPEPEKAAPDADTPEARRLEREKERAARRKAEEERRAEVQGRKNEEQAAREAEKARKKQEKEARKAEKAREEEAAARAKAEQQAEKEPAKKEGKKKKREKTTEAEPPPGVDYEPLDTSRTIDETVEGMYDEGPTAPGVVSPGPDAPDTAAPPRPPREEEPVPESTTARLEVPAERKPFVPEEKPYTGPAWPTLPAPAPGNIILEEVVARVNDDLITKSELDKRLRILEDMPDSAGYEESDLEERRKGLIPAMVDEKLLIRRAEEMGINREKVYQVAKKEFQERNGIEGDLQLVAFLERSGMDMGDFREIIMRNYVPRLVLEREVRGSVKVTDEKVRAFYEEHLEEMRSEEIVRAREIVLRKGSDADVKTDQIRLVEVMQRLEGDEDFSAVAKEVSDAPSASRGGELEPIRRGELTPDIEERIFRLVEGELAVEKMPYGYHILLVEEHTVPRVPEFDEVAPAIRMNMERDQFFEDLKEYMKKLRARSFIQVDPEYAARFGAVLN